MVISCPFNIPCKMVLQYIPKYTILDGYFNTRNIPFKTIFSCTTNIPFEVALNVRGCHLHFFLFLSLVAIFSGAKRFVKVW